MSVTDVVSRRSQSAALSKRSAGMTCLIMAVIGDPMEERFPAGIWPAAAYPIADRFLELLESEPAIVAAASDLRDHCLVLRIDVGDGTRDRPQPSFAAITRKLKPAILSALTAPYKTARAVIRKAAGLGGGHITASVILLDNRERAREFCGRMVEEASKEAAQAEKRRDRVRALLEPDASQPFSRRISRLKNLRQLVHEEIASELQDAFNAQIRSMPHQTYPQQRALVIWVNSQLRDLGLAVRCPKTGLPGILIADTSSPDSTVGRIRMDVRDDSGRRIRTHIFALPLALSIMPDRERVEGLAKSPR